MNLRITRGRFWFLLRIALPIATVLILFFSGIFPLEKLLTASPQSLTASVAPADVASLTNEERIVNGLPPLVVSPFLTEAAQLKADDMAAHSYYAHTGPDGKTMLDWMHEVGYTYLNAGENLVIDRTTASQAVDAWMNSPDHRANILRPQFTQLGIGVAEGEYQGIHTIFVVQEFGTPYPTAATIAASANLPKASTPAERVSSPQPKPATSSRLTVPNVPPPAVIPHISSLAPIKAAAPAYASSSATSSVQVVPDQGTSTLSFTLAPEFYAPVTLTPQANAQDAMQSPAPQGTSVSRLWVWLQGIPSYIQHIFVR